MRNIVTLSRGSFESAPLRLMLSWEERFLVGWEHSKKGLMAGGGPAVSREVLKLVDKQYHKPILRQVLLNLY
jgi:hypothetical protein